MRMSLPKQILVQMIFLGVDEAVATLTKPCAEVPFMNVFIDIILIKSRKLLDQESFYRMLVS